MGLWQSYVKFKTALLGSTCRASFISLMKLSLRCYPPLRRHQFTFGFTYKSFKNETNILLQLFTQFVYALYNQWKLIYFTMKILWRKPTFFKCLHHLHNIFLFLDAHQWSETGFWFSFSKTKLQTGRSQFSIMTQIEH